MIKIIHLSDFHLESENLTLQKENLVNALLSDLEKHVCENSMLIFSGDLIDKSGVAFSDKALAFDYFEEYFIEPIVKKFPVLAKRFFIVPGNHDFDRSLVDEFTDYPRRSGFLSNPETVNKFISKTQRDRTANSGLKNYKEFEDTFYKKYHDVNDYQFSIYDTSFNLIIDGQKIGISCLNSSWLCFDNDEKDKIFIGKAQIEESLKFIKPSKHKFAIFHHPTQLLNHNDYEEINPILYHNYDILFMGHTHKLEGKNVDDINGSLFQSVGKSVSAHNSKESEYKCGYSIVEYYPNEKFIVRYKKYIDNSAKFVINTDIGNDEGIKEYHILKGNELQLFNTSKSIIDTIKKDYLTKLNEDLILNISESTKATLKEIFVEPIIGNLPESNLEQQDSINYFESGDLLQSYKSYLIFGPKDIGKTILINKLLVDLTENFGNGKVIPVHIRYREIGNKSPFQLVREYILKDSDQTRAILTDKDIRLTILIDDLDFSDDYLDFHKQLQQFMKDYININIIATTSFTDDAALPIKSISRFNEITTNCEVLYLHHFKSKQIKGLISNWVTSAEEDMHSNIEKLIKGFSELGLPKTPLAVTLFLWIINKQEKKPINNAVLVEMFIENLLEKGNIKNIYFDTFDFGDKQRLLAYVAKFMLDEGNKNLSYSVDKYSLLKFIENYLKLKIDISAEKVLEYLIDRGVLAKSNGTCVRFKSGFFFNYFLAKYMTFEKSFKNFVFSENNYGNYINEIDFYTGLNREDDEVFDFMMNELTEAFDFINQDIRDNDGKLDAVLETEKSITTIIDMEKVKNKPSEKKIEEVYDNQMTNIPNKNDVEPKDEPKDEDSKPGISKILKLAAIVLKNSSDIDSSKRKQAYDTFIISSMSFVVLYRNTLIQIYQEDKEVITKFIPKKINFHYFLTLLPIIHQVTMYNWLGSLKIAPIIRSKIQEDQQSVNISEFERFLSVFIYADVRGRNHDVFVENLIKDSKRRYILDACFIKNMTYYHLRSKTKDSDQRFTKLLADIKVKLNDISKRGKGAYMHQLEQKKKNG